MCGIVGYVGRRDVKDFLLEGLRRLEYRGYDSAGIAVIGQDGVQDGIFKSNNCLLRNFLKKSINVVYQSST